MGLFLGSGTPSIAVNRGFSSIVRTAAAAAGSYDITMDPNVFGQFSATEMVFMASASPAVDVYVTCNWRIVSPTLVRITCFDVVGAALVNADFCFTVHRIN